MQKEKQVIPENKIILLSQLKKGQKFKIIKITVSGEIGKRLADMGFSKGVEGKYIRCALFGDPIQLRLRGYDVSLRKSEAEGIEVELVQCCGGHKGHCHCHNHSGEHHEHK